MAKRVIAQKTQKARPAPDVALGPGLHPASVELRSGDSYRVRLLDGAVIAATIDEEVEPALVDECLRAGRRVVVAATPRGPMILGALQTSLPVVRDANGTVVIEAKKIRFKAEKELVLETGESALRLSADGVLRLEGDKMVIDVGGLVRFLSARVEFP
jgi:hypothetical protein